MKVYKLTVVVDGNFHTTKTVESDKLSEEILRNFMISTVQEHKLDHPTSATFEFNISEFNSFRRHLTSNEK